MAALYLFFAALMLIALIRMAPDLAVNPKERVIAIIQYLYGLLCAFLFLWNIYMAFTYDLHPA